MRLIATALGLAAVAVIGILDYAIPAEYGFSLLYVVVVAVVAWRAGYLPGFTVAIAATAAWTQAELATSAFPLVAIGWNAFTRSIIFSGVALLIGALRDDQVRLRALDREREEFLALVAHELRQPVAAIGLAAAAMAASPDLGAAEKGVLAGLRTQAHRLSGLAEDLLTVSRLEGGRLDLSPAPADLREIVDAAVKGCGDPDRVSVAASPGPVVVRADPFRVAQCVDNLVSNALKYSPLGSAVEVRTSASDRVARVEVRDQGIGIAPTELPKLFRKYGRVGDRAAMEGVGLGLYLVRLIAEAHGGGVTAESLGLGRGSVFTLELPLGAT